MNDRFVYPEETKTVVVDGESEEHRILKIRKYNNS